MAETATVASQGRKRIHLYFWQPEIDGTVGKLKGGEMNHFVFDKRDQLINHLNQIAMELATQPSFAGERGLLKSSKMTLKDYVENGYIYIVYGSDLDVELSSDTKSVTNVFYAE